MSIENILPLVGAHHRTIELKSHGTPHGTPFLSPATTDMFSTPGSKGYLVILFDWKKEIPVARNLYFNILKEFLIFNTFYIDRDQLSSTGP